MPLNVLQSREHKGARAMAGLLLSLMVGPLLSGCLLPQDDQVFVDLPPKRNSPPRIVTWQPDQQSVGFKSGTGCTNGPRSSSAWVPC